MCGKTETLFSIKVNNHKKCNNIIKRSPALLLSPWVIKDYLTSFKKVFYDNRYSWVFLMEWKSNTEVRISHTEFLQTNSVKDQLLYKK